MKLELPRTGFPSWSLGTRVNVIEPVIDRRFIFASYACRQGKGTHAAGRLDWDGIDPAVQSWIGHPRHADTVGLRARIFSDIVVRRGASQTMAGG